MSISGQEPPTQVQTGLADQYDHSIILVDTTQPPPDNGSDAEGERKSEDGSLHRKWTRGKLREEIVRRKYARFQEGKYNGDEGTSESSDTDEGRRGSTASKLGKKDLALAQINRLRNKIPFKSKLNAKVRPQEEYEVDVLYENQRGMFFCGIPLYSSKSLLNFDPAPWQTSNFRESPVNITNAQLPDPSWAWAWKTWYVDMSHDVDEEGWEYSLSFQQGFSWHGTHPWFHSFARRRRWLRKRIKIQRNVHSGAKGSMKEAHMLNADYFTIHAARRESSRDSSAERSTVNRASIVSSKHESEAEEDNEDINNVLMLTKAFKGATVDRKRSEAFRNFLEHGGDELYYLADKIPDLMSMFVYPASRQHVYEDLQIAYDSIVHPEPTGADDPAADRSLQQRRKDNLLKAMLSAKSHDKTLEYWSDIKRHAPNDQSSDRRLVGSDDHGSLPPLLEQFGETEMDENVIGKDDLKGIPAGADIGGPVLVDRLMKQEEGERRDQGEQEARKAAIRKGKERA